MTTPLWALGATELAHGIGTGELTSRDVVAAHLDRISAVNPLVNAITVALGEQAFCLADAADKALELGLPAGPLHGVPFTVKETIDVAGSATTFGIVGMRNAMPQSDARRSVKLPG